jgi:hypothetical protein
MSLCPLVVSFLSCYHNPISFLEIVESITYTSKQAIMADTATVVAADDEVIDPKASAIRKAYDIQNVSLFKQLAHSSCPVRLVMQHVLMPAFFLFNTVAGGGCLQRLTMSMP